MIKNLIAQALGLTPEAYFSKFQKEMVFELQPILKELNQLRLDVQKFPEIDEKEEFWNNKWPKAPIIYTARNDKPYDVRTFITYPSEVLSEFNKKVIKILSSDTNDTKALKILKFVQDNITYKSDTGEYWSFPTDVLHSTNGDCEDGTHLIVSLLRNAGILSYRIKVACGWALDRTTQQKFGHSYPIYLRESDDEWVHLDWCFYPTKDLIRNRTICSDNKDYGDIWFSFNNQFSWNNVSLEIDTKKISYFEVR